MNRSFAKQSFARFIPWVLYASAAYFLYWFIRDARDELFINPVHFFDDAYMFIRYARIWHLGYGESWNIGEGPVYGNTSQLHFLLVLVLTSFQSLGNEMVIKLSSALPAFVLMAWLPWFCARHGLLFRQYALPQRYLLWTGIACPFLYWHTPYDYHWLTGMDTMLSMLLQLWLVDAMLCYRRDHKPVQLCLVTVLVMLAVETRPENLLVCMAFVGFYLLFLERRIRELLVVSAAVGIFVLLDALFKKWYFGDFVPLAFYSKKTDYLEGFAAIVANHPLLPVSHFLVYIWPLVAIHLLSATRKDLKTILWFAVPVILVVGYFMSMMSIMNMRARYEFPLIIYAMASVVCHVDGFRPILASRKALFIRASVAGLLLVALMQLKINSAWIVRYMLGEQHGCDLDMISAPVELDRSKYTGHDALVQMSNLLHDFPAGTTVVMTEHGYVGANNLHINIIDVIGLHNRYIAHNGFSAQWLFERKPDAIWVPHWNYTCLDHRIFSEKAFWDHYQLYPLLFGWGIALRTDSPFYSVMHEALVRHVHTLYPEYTLDQLEKKRPAGF